MSEKEITWVILELTERGEEEARQGRLAQIVCKYGKFKPNDLFIPIINTGECSTNLMEGYIFIKSIYPVSSYLSICRTPYVANLLSDYDSVSGLTGSGVISDSQLKKMVKKASDKGGVFRSGDEITIKNGDFTGLTGKIIEVLDLDETEWFTQNLPPEIELRKAMVRKWVENGCRPLRTKILTTYNENVVYYLVSIKLRSIEIVTILDNFCLE